MGPWWHYDGAVPPPFLPSRREEKSSPRRAKKSGTFMASQLKALAIAERSPGTPDPYLGIFVRLRGGAPRYGREGLEAARFFFCMAFLFATGFFILHKAYLRVESSCTACMSCENVRLVSL